LRKAPVVPRIALNRPLRSLLVSGAAALMLAGCAVNSTTTQSLRVPDLTSQTPTEQQQTLSQLAARYKASPHDKATIIAYAAALRAVGQPAQAVAVIENGMLGQGNDADLKVDYAKALAAAGRYQQALTVITDAIRPDAPDWNALLVKGAVLDQLGRNAEARAVYTQALLIDPNEASLDAIMGLSSAMTNALTEAEQHLRKATTMPGATSKIRQNLALVVGLEGRFDEARKLFAAELPPAEVDSNMAYIRSLLTQQNRWAEIKGGQ
jgi:Flp pilus assembly protein TadD